MILAVCFVFLSWFVVLVFSIGIEIKPLVYSLAH